MSITLSPERLDLSERVKLRPKRDGRDFVAMFGFADGPMAGKRPSRRNESEVAPLMYEGGRDTEPVA